jgi:hypothetical protein
MHARGAAVVENVGFGGVRRAEASGACSKRPLRLRRVAKSRPGCDR